MSNRCETPLVQCKVFRRGQSLYSTRAWQLGISLALVLGIGARDWISAQELPPEASLPSTYRFALPSQDARQATLPSESSLPPKRQSKVEDGNIAPGQKTELPSESELPSQSKKDEAPAAGDQQNQLQRLLNLSRDRLPWLRLVEAEHTSPIRVLRFDESGDNLYTAGEDKLVHRWSHRGAAEGQWQHRADYRWQVQRAELGTILALDTSGNELYFAGMGAEGQQGEIVALNTRTDAWLPPIADAESGHHSPVIGLHVLSKQPVRRLVSADQKHGFAVWTQHLDQGTWSHRWIRAPETNRKFRYAPFAIVQPKFVLFASETKPWKIDQIDIDSGQITRDFKGDAELLDRRSIAHAIQVASDFYGSAGKEYTFQQLTPAIRNSVGRQVICIAASSDGSYIAAADELGFLYLWNKQGQLVLKSVASFDGFRFETIVFSRDLRYLAASAINEQREVSMLQLWRLTKGQIPTLERELSLSTRVTGIDLSPDGSRLVFGNGRRVEVIPTEQPNAPTARISQESILTATEVAFSNELPYRWRMKSPQNELAFNGATVGWMDVGEAEWNTVTDRKKNFIMGDWSLVSQADTPAGDTQDWIMQGNKRVGRLELSRHYSLKPSSRIQHVAWVKDQDANVVGLAISLSEQNDIWYFSLPRGGDTVCPLRRVYRGHESAVSSIDTSPDGRYLISCAADSTIRLWPTVGLFNQDKFSRPQSTWGFNFEIDDGRVVALDPVFAGPLYTKGLREGDRLKEISYENFAAGGRLQRTTLRQPDEMVAFLSEPRMDVAVRYIFERAGVEVPGFQAYPHWRELAALVVATNREWAFWTPSGFYDSSFNGNSLFGWQINLGIEKEPAFFRADRFQNVLERPDLIQHLLTEGSVQQAAQKVNARRIGFGDVLRNSIALQPRVRILSPDHESRIVKRSLEIRAEVILRQGQSLASSKAFVSGVSAGDMQAVAHETLDGGLQRIELRCNAVLPSDNQLAFQVFCSTREKIVGTDSIALNRADKPQATRKPRMHIIAAGVSKYQDSGRIPTLELGARNAIEFTDAASRNAGDLYDVRPLMLTDSSVTRAVWRSSARGLRDSLQDVQPDDLIVVFLSGHGVVDDSNGKYYFVTVNARYRDLVRKDFSDCLSFEDLTRWTNVPCRKIAILDTCHSGAIQPLDMQSLKHAVRFLQGDLFLTLTASEGNQLAAEYRGAQASLFTEVIRQSLEKRKDIDLDGQLSWPEFVNQVQSLVKVRSVAGSVPQFPMAGPRDLLDVIDLPVAKAGNPETLVKWSMKSRNLQQRSSQ